MLNSDFTYFYGLTQSTFGFLGRTHVNVPRYPVLAFILLLNANREISDTSIIPQDRYLIFNFFIFISEVFILHAQIKNSFLFYIFTLFICLSSFFLTDTDAQIPNGPGVGSASEDYTFETIDVPGVDFLALTASSDFEDYAGYTKSADGEKEVAFTLIDGVFMTYDFPGSQKTHFYALGNNGIAAGHYQDSDGLYHGIILENGELRQYDFPGSVQTEIHGISDTTGALTGNFIDASGVRRGFTAR